MMGFWPSYFKKYISQHANILIFIEPDFDRRLSLINVIDLGIHGLIETLCHG